MNTHQTELFERKLTSEEKHELYDKALSKGVSPYTICASFCQEQLCKEAEHCCYFPCQSWTDDK
jgi:hypothetical protein